MTSKNSESVGYTAATQLIKLTVAAVVFIIALPIAFLSWMVELRIRAKIKREDEQAQFEDDAS
jgi:hypothetical protein